MSPERPPEKENRRNLVGSPGLRFWVITPIFIITGVYNFVALFSKLCRFTKTYNLQVATDVRLDMHLFMK